MPFYLYCKLGRWSFGVALEPGLDPAEVGLTGRDRRLTEGYYRGGETDTADVSPEEARRIVRAAADDFLRWRDASPEGRAPAFRHPWKR